MKPYQAFKRKIDSISLFEKNILIVSVVIVVINLYYNIEILRKLI